MRKMCDVRFEELNEMLRKSFIRRHESINQKLDDVDKRVIPGEAWTKLIANSIIEKDLIIIDDVFSGGSDWNKVTKLAVLDVVKKEGFDISMKVTGSNVISVICDQVNIDTELFYKLKESDKIQSKLRQSLTDIEHLVFDDGSARNVGEFVTDLIHEKGWQEIIKTNKKTFIGSTSLNQGYQLTGPLKVFATIKLEELVINQEIDALQKPDDIIVWGANSTEEHSLLPSM